MKAQSLDVEMYDPSWFVDFSFAEKDPVKLVGAPAACKLAVRARARAAQARRASRAKRSSTISTPASNYGAQFANKIAVKCP